MHPVVNTLNCGVRGGTLFYALAVSMIIGMITAGVLLNAHYNRLLIHRDTVQEEVVRNSVSGVRWMCAQKDSVFVQQRDIDLFGREKDSVRLCIKPWGLYDLFFSTAHTGKQSHERAALTGSFTAGENRIALWLGDMDHPLKVCGNTLLKGNCALPRAGIERTYLEGRGFSGRTLVQGRISTSDRFVPKYNEERFSALCNLLKSPVATEDSLLSWEEFSNTDSVSCSFLDRTCVISENKALTVANICAEGRLIIHSTVRIDVKRSSRLTNVILVAPKVVIEKETEGQFQVIARDSIIVEKEVHLRFPSALCICADRSAVLQGAIWMDEECMIGGSVFAAHNVPEINRQVHVRIGKECEITGNVFCNGFIDLQGSVFGTVTCSKFRLQTNSAVYDNVLLNAVIDASRYPEQQPAELLFTTYERKEVIAWLR